MRGVLAGIATALALSGCGASDALVDTSPIQGKWRIEGVRGDSLPSGCKNAGYEITASQITMRSGELTIVASYRAERSGRGFLLRQFALSHNGRPNCQGISAEYVVAHYLMDLDVDLIDGRLRVYFPDRTHDRYSDFSRFLGA